MRILLVSTYELGHQPLHVASPAAALLGAGHDVRCADIAVAPLDRRQLDWAEAVGFSVPMHTAMRIAISAATEVRTEHPDLPICFYGLYAAVGRDRTVGTIADFVIAGEYEDELVAWVDRLAAGGTATFGDGVAISLRQNKGSLPARELLPGLANYARLAIDGEERLVGYVEASRGCRHRCRHCPIPIIYDGRFRIVDVEALLADVAQLVGMGAQHLTFGDPDFLNGPRHSLRAVQAIKEAFPDLTFDVTAKIEHVLAVGDDVWAELAESGLLFVVSAFEILNDDILGLLDKGHTAADAAAAVHLLRKHGIAVRPSWLPFTPWTSLGDVIDIFEFVGRHDLYGNVDPVQFTIRLLIPEGSLITELPEAAQFLEDYDSDLLTYRWRSADPRVDHLQEDLSVQVAKGIANGDGVTTILERIWAVALEAAGSDAKLRPVPAGSVPETPRLTEPWFC